MLIAQVTDLHLHADAAHPNRARFERVLAHLLAMWPQPDLLVLSGDLADDGAADSYRHLQAALATWPHPVRLALGNHDDRAAFLSVFGQDHADGGFVQGRALHQGLHILALDTLEAGRHGGAFCEARARWLRAELDAIGTAPVLVFLHHPPADVGISWIDPGPRQDWIARLDTALQGANVVAICSGHVHVSASLRWRGRAVLTCTASSSDLSLAFAPMDASRPDGRPLVEQGEPAFALHRWQDGELATLFGRVPQRVVAHWNDASRQVVGEMLGESRRG